LLSWVGWIVSLKIVTFLHSFSSLVKVLITLLITEIVELVKKLKLEINCDQFNEALSIVNKLQYL
jgi:hypothetical protein